WWTWSGYGTLPRRCARKRGCWASLCPCVLSNCWRIAAAKPKQRGYEHAIHSQSSQPLETVRCMRGRDLCAPAGGISWPRRSRSRHRPTPGCALAHRAAPADAPADASSGRAKGGQLMPRQKRHASRVYQMIGEPAPGATAAGYVRYSMELQDPASIVTQKRRIEEFAAKKGWTVVRWYEEPEQSAKYEEIERRPVFARLLEDAGRDFPIVLCYMNNRWARNT